VWFAARLSRLSSVRLWFVVAQYPYMNGVLHLGHAFTLTKAEFMARYQRLLGKRVIFPFGFHCTGMPICVRLRPLSRRLLFVGSAHAT
jgi:leucyl-tRNA synthetase